MRQVLGFGLLSLMACASAQPNAQALAGDDQPAIVRPTEGGVSELRVGQLLQVELPGNASTGYQWRLLEDGSPILERIMPAAPAKEADEPADPERVGTPSTSRWWFKAARPGRAVLRLVYQRPWEKDVPPAQTVDYLVTVE
jgi:inhibitor of cysteine peptidase